MRFHTRDVVVFGSIIAVLLAAGAWFLLTPSDDPVSRLNYVEIDVGPNTCSPACRIFMIHVDKTGAAIFTLYSNSRALSPNERFPQFLEHRKAQLPPETFQRLRKVIDQLDIYDLPIASPATCKQGQPRVRVGDSRRSPKDIYLSAGCPHEIEAASKLIKEFVSITGTSDYYGASWPP